MLLYLRSPCGALSAYVLQTLPSAVCVISSFCTFCVAILVLVLIQREYRSWPLRAASSLLASRLYVPVPDLYSAQPVVALHCQ